MSRRLALLLLLAVSPALAGEVGLRWTADPRCESYRVAWGPSGSPGGWPSKTTNAAEIWLPDLPCVNLVYAVACQAHGQIGEWTMLAGIPTIARARKAGRRSCECAGISPLRCYFKTGRYA